tara:strand:+ start:111 stop:1028 length:918 start_codon:yes stop_codon:yes gene_type:complete
MYHSKDITVLIATKDRVKQIERAIRSSVNQSINPRVVVLDDASKVNIKDELAEKFSDFQIDWIRSDMPSGVAGARNKLVENSSGSIMVFLDDDAYFEDENCLEKILKKFSSSEGLAAMAFKIILRQGTEGLQIPFSRLERIFKKNIHNKETEVSYYVGAGHVLLREVFEKIGGYDDDFFYGLEELDLSSSIIKERGNIIYFPLVKVIHEPQRSVVNKKNQLKDETYYSIRNRIWVSYKHLPKIYFISHLFIWCSYYFIKSLFKFQLIKYFFALRDGLLKLKYLKRKPFDSESLKYLKKNYGRLWY